MSAATKAMRGFLIAIVLVGLGALSYWQKREQKPEAPAHQPVASQPAIPSPTSAPQVSDVNWMKRSLDRARDVAGKARAQAKENQDP
jgi:hypothetical protein